MPTTFASLENKKYRWLFAGNLAMFFSISSRMMLISLLAWEITQNETSLAFINFALAIPMFTGALIAGAIVDRLERRKLILSGLIVVLIGESSVLIALLFNQLTYTHLLIATFIGGCAHPFIMPASTTVMFGLLGKAQIANGFALMSGAMNLSRVLGPSITGIVAAFIGTDIAFAIVVMLSFTAFICQWQLPKSFPILDKTVSIAEDIVIGFRYLFQSKVILLCLLYGLIPILLAISVQYFLVVLADKMWMAGASGLGILLAAMGSGGIVGSLIVARIGERYSRAKLMLISSISCAVFFGCFGASDSFVVAVVLLGVANMFAIISQVVNQVSIQLLVDEKVRGRVSGYVLMSFSLGPFAVIPLAYFIQSVGPKFAIVGAACIAVVLSSLFYLMSTQLKNIDERIRCSK